MRIVILLLLLLHFNKAFSQSLSPEKVKKIKSSTVQIIADTLSGTGFIIDSKGTVATCLHVVRNVLGTTKPIYVRTNNGELFQQQLPEFTDSGYVHLLAYDLCILKPVQPLLKPVTFLKLGDFKKLQEGQEVYTCGYPFSSVNQFLSKGLISTKIINTVTTSVPLLGINNISEIRHELLLDITSNQGNSGGALMKLNSSTAEDEVVGIIDYMITPIAGKLDSITSVISQSSWAGVSFGTISDANGKVISGGYNPVTTSLLFSQWFRTITYGINGAVSVNHLSQLLKELKK